MKNGEAKLINGSMKLIRLRQVFTWTLLIVSALSVSRVEAFYYTTHRSRVNGPRSTSSSVAFGTGTSDRSRIQPIGNANVVGQLCQDESGNVIVRWPIWRTFLEETLPIGQFKSEADFLKVYAEKCQERDDKPDGKRVLGADYERKRVYMASGKKMWAAHLKVLQVTRAAEKKFLQGLPLESLFGIKIGKPVDLALYEKTDTENCYVFKPARQFRKFDSYSFRVTPKTHVVYQIRAKSDAFAATEGLDEEWNYVKQVFMKKFQKKAVKELPDHNGYLLLFPGAGAGVEREIVIRRYGDAASIMAVDLKLAKQAEDERTSIDAKSLVPSGNDVDAL